MTSAAQTNDLRSEFEASRPKSVECFRRASQVLAGGVGHDLRHFEPVPLYISHGRGGRKWDVDGNEYVDFLMGNGALLLGHAHPQILEAIHAAAARGTHFGNDHLLQVEWAELIQALVPSAERVRFVNSGTEATLLAIRLARAATGRPKLLRFEGHFHGWHDDVVHGFQPPFQADGSLGVPASVRDNQVAIPDRDLDLVDQTLAKDPNIGAIILEPSGASWGRVPIRVDFLRGLREIATRRRALLIFDEVITGFRFSPGGAQQLYEVIPDLSCFAKIMAGGLPGGAVVGKANIMSLFDQTGNAQHDRFERVTHFGTFNACPLAAAAGIVVLNNIRSGDAIGQANCMAESLRHEWNQVLQRHHIAGYVYGPASTFHVYFETDMQRIGEAKDRDQLKTTDPSRLKGMPANLVTSYQRAIRFHGVDIMSSTGGVLSAAHTDDDIRRATDAFQRTITYLLEEQLIHRMPS